MFFDSVKLSYVANVAPHYALDKLGLRGAGSGCVAKSVDCRILSYYYVLCANVAQLVEHAHGKGEVIGSIPIIGSIELLQYGISSVLGLVLLPPYLTPRSSDFVGAKWGWEFVPFMW